MLKKILLALIVGAVSLAADPILPNNELQLGLLSEAAKKKLIVLATMRLKGEQKKNFGNKYDEYQKNLIKLRIDELKLIKEYGANYEKMDDKAADKLLADWIKLQKEQLALKEKYIEEFKKILPSSLVIRFFQIENRIEILKEARVARQIPLAIPEQAKEDNKIQNTKK